MTNENTLYKTLYKLNSDKKTIQVWHIHHNETSYWTVSGRLGGKLILNAPTVVEPKQKRTQLEQVVFVCKSQIEKKRRKKYVEDVNNIHSADNDLDGWEPMLAHSYDKKKSKTISKKR